MISTGTITKLNTELKYGFISDPKIGNIFFSEDTVYKGIIFSKLKIGMEVTAIIEETKRGLFANSITLKSSIIKNSYRNLETNI